MRRINKRSIKIKILDSLKYFLGMRSNKVSPKTKRKKSDIINSKVLQDIMIKADKIPTTKRRNTYKIAIIILANSGMRIDCLRSFDQQVFKEQFFDNKTNIIRYIPNKRKGSQAYLSFFMTSKDIDQIQRLYQEYVKVTGNHNPFDTTTDSLRTHFNEFLKSTGYNITSHSFRRSILTRIIETKGIHTAKEFIGHSSIMATERYYLGTLNPEKMQQINKIISNM